MTKVNFEIFVKLKPHYVNKIDIVPKTDRTELHVEPLVKSIKEQGYNPNKPLIVNRRENGKYVVIHGNRRYYAGVEAGVDDFPCIVFNNLTDAEVRLVQLDTI